MKNQVPALVIDEATKCRSFFETYVNKLRGVASYSNSTLSCYCATASWLLWERLRKNENVHLHYGKYYGAEHCWISVGKMIIDITATQFGVNHKVYIVPISSYGYESLVIDYDAIESFNDSSWPYEQVCFLTISNRQYIKNKYRKFRLTA